MKKYFTHKDSDLDKYEKSLAKQNLENGTVPNVEAFERKVFTQERDFFKEKLNEIEEEQIKLASYHDALLAEGKIQPEQIQKEKDNLDLKKKFFERKLQQVEHDLFIVNKNKYDLIKFATFA